MYISGAVQLLAAEMLGLAATVLVLFRLRRRISLTPLYVSLGVFQPVQVLLSSSVYVDLWPGVPVSPGTLMFGASLLAVLLVYIREGAVEARKIIYGVIGANLIMCVVMYMVHVQLKTPGTSDFLNIPPEMFSQGARVSAVGSGAFLVDVVLLIGLYTALRHYVPRHPFLRVFVTMGGVLTFDAVAFTTGAFFERADFLSLLYAAVLSKLLVASCCSAALVIYLRFVEPEDVSRAQAAGPLRDFFHTFTYREKFELQAQRTSDIEARLAKRLVFLAEVMADSAGWIPISQSELGEFLGATRESVNKTLNDWRNRSIIAIKRGGLRITDGGVLRHIAESQDDE